MHKYHKTSGSSADDRAIAALGELARGGLSDFLRNLRKPDKSLLLAKITTELVIIEKKYGHEMHKKHPDPVVLRMHEMDFITQAKNYEGIAGEPYMVGRYHIDPLSRQCRRVHPQRK
jgi:hypothetical protein